MIADAKGVRKTNTASKEPEDVPPRSRLFIICSKDTTEDELVKQFAAFGDLEYFKLVKDKNTKESRGCGYAKFSRASSAALAMETLNEQSEKSENLN
jgi:RNA recognition motif-containing protein